MWRMLWTLRLSFLVVLQTILIYPMAQPGTAQGFKPDLKRQLFHDYVDREQKAALKADGRSDNFFKASENEEINYLVTQALTQKIDALQSKIEKDSLTSHSKKVYYIRGLENLLKTFTGYYKNRQFNVSNLPLLIDTYETAMNKDKKDESIERIIDRSNYEIGNVLLKTGAFENNSGYRSSKNILVRKYAHAYPGRIFSTLRDNPDVPFRDSLILVAAYKNPRQLYDYAAANNQLGYAIRKLDDPLIQTVSKMATSGGSGQLYFPFLDNILKGRQSIEEIDAVKNDNVKYFKLLVKTRMDYVSRALDKEKVMGMGILDTMLQRKAKEEFVKTINALHNESDAVRFRILHQLTPQELYYVAVSSEDEIYTSSYTRGVYPIMMQKIGNRGDSLMYSVGFDRFKKFIKLAAGFNTLNSFLKSFPDKEQSKSLMTAFVNGLEKSTGLEDGVDVADSYVSIAEGDKVLAKYILDLTKYNYDKNIAQNNQRGATIYNLLYKLFLSADSTNNIDLSKEFGIPPVYSVSHEALSNTENKHVIMQVFFYGDEDGQNIFQGFLRQFSSGNWKIAHEKQWVAITSTNGKPISIFANKPLPEESGQDEEAQRALNAFLDKKGLEPTVVIHRGHSYYAPYTIQHIKPSAKIVFLGSCGGYHLIHDVLSHAPDAHIIASKQIGMTRINQPFFNLLNEKLRNGNNIDWIPFWKDFKRSTGPVDGFDDYIPPHKNLGAIFIKAYKIQRGEQEEI